MERRVTFLGAVIGLLTRAVGVGIVFGCLTGLIEVLGLLHRADGTNLPMLVPAIFFYATAWAVLTAICALPVWLIQAVRGRLQPGAWWTRFHAGVLTAVVLLIVIGGYINRTLLPSRLDPRSLAFNGVFLLVSLAVGVLIHMRLAPAAQAAAARHPRISSAMGIVFAVVLSVFLGGPTVWSMFAVSSKLAPPVAFPTGPNVLILTVDAMRPDHMSVYGYERPTTPNLEQFAREGVRFDNAYATSCWTRASVASIFTSLFPSTHNVNGIATGLPASVTILPEALHDRGYATGVFSANTFVSPMYGYGQGVDRFYVRPRSMLEELIVGHVLRSVRRFHPAIGALHHHLERMEIPPQPGGPVDDTAPGLNKAFLRWIDQLNGRPFFAYFHYMDAHTPYVIPKPYEGMFDPGFNGPFPKETPIHDGLAPFTVGQIIPEADRLHLVAQYDAAINYVDHHFGELFAALKQRGLYDNTVIVITADHGEEFYEHQGWGHGKSLYQTLVHVPMIVRAPGITPQGVTSTRIVRHIDLLPTVVELCRAALPPNVEGQSLATALKDPAAVPPQPAYMEVFHDREYARAISDGRYKLIESHRYDDQLWQLFDLEQDPGEHSAQDPEQHPEGARLKRLMQAFEQRAASKSLNAATVQVDASTRERLKSLGYVN